MAFAWLFPSELNTAVFREAWLRVVTENSVLRAGIEERSGTAQQVLLSPERLSTQMLELNEIGDPKAAFRGWCDERSSKPLPLNGPLLDSVLVNLGEHGFGWYLNLHHVIADAHASVLLYQQVSREYTAMSQGEDPVSKLNPYYPTAAGLVPEPDRLAVAQAHWSARKMAGVPIVSMYGETGIPSGTASTRYTLQLTPSQMQRMNQCCGQEGFASLSPDLSRFSFFATVLLAWQRRVSGNTKLGFDTPVAGRASQEAKNALGLFIEIFPFSVLVSEDDSFRTLGGKCLDEAYLLLQHAIPGSSEPSEESAANVVLNYFPERFAEFAGMSPAVRWVHPGHGDSAHALRLQVQDFDGDGCFTLHFDFNDRVIPKHLCQRSLEHFEILLESILSDPDQSIDRVKLLTEQESGMLDQLNDTDRYPFPNRTVVARFDEQARATPESIALRQGQLEISYRQLSEQVDALATSLIDEGVQAGDFVAIAGRRSVDSVVAILATLRTRAAYVPLDRNYPVERIRYMLQDCHVRLVLLGDVGASMAHFDRLETLDIQTGINRGLGKPPPRLDCQMSDLAYLLYTSGSSGRPKGVPIEHGGLADYVDWAARKYVRDRSWVFPLFTSLSFDLTVTSLFLPLATGGVLEIYPEPDGPVDSAVMEVVEQNRAHFIKLTPSHLSLLLDADLEDSEIRCVVVGGEDFKTSLASNISKKFSQQVEIYNEYGPTEAVVGCVAHRFDPERDRGNSVPIGRPADHVTIEVLNQQMVPVPEGVPGELWVSRPGLARGYHGEEELTRKYFLPNPGEPDRLRYGTGDLVRWCAPGQLEFLGRKDRQLKIDGHRIEAAEIEAALLSLPEVGQCAVIERRFDPYASPADTQQYCIRCGLSHSYPHVSFDQQGVCSICHSYEAIRERAGSYFKSLDDLRVILDQSREHGTSTYDCMMLLSGGKDSTYALCQLVEMGISVYALTLDNGFISNEAKSNISRITEQLGVTVEFARTDSMNAIFRDSLARFSNVCQGCFKTLYTLSTNRALQLGIPIIVTGLSRGQMFETRLTEDMFEDDRRTVEDVDAAVLAARKLYHRVDDEVSRSLDVSAFQDDKVFEQVRFIDFYRYKDVGLEEVLEYLEVKIGWQRPKDTGRSTNCLINDVGIFIHNKEKGFHNYALPYSWDVRLGHKTREAAIDELQDRIDVDQVNGILEEIDYRGEHELATNRERSVLWGFYTATREIPENVVRERLGNLLPAKFIPTHFRRLESIPLTANGKIDEDALPWHSYELHGKRFVPLDGPVEEYLGELWQRELECGRVGGDDHFFQLGGTSLYAMRVMVSLCREFDIDLPLETIFHQPKLRDLARVAEEQIFNDVEQA